MKVRAFEKAADICMLIDFWINRTSVSFPYDSETFQKSALRLILRGLLTPVTHDSYRVTTHGSSTLQRLLNLPTATALRSLTVLSVLLDVHIFGDVQPGSVATANSRTAACERLTRAGLIQPAMTSGWYVTSAGKVLIQELLSLEIEVPDAPVSKSAQPFEVWQKHAQALEGLLYRAHAEAGAEIEVLARPTQKPFVEDENAVRLANARLLETILYDLYCFNSEHGTTTEQDERLAHMGFTLFNSTAERLAKQAETGGEQQW